MIPYRAKSGVAALVLGVASLLLAPATSGQSADFSPYVSEAGAITLPTNYRTEFVFIGAWGIEGGAEEKISGFHNVYTSRGVVEHFQATGEFPDGAVLVKELLGSVSGAKTTGSVAWAGEVQGWFVMVKDSEGRFPENPLWGNGWGWSLFNPDNPGQTVSTNFRTDCLGCHVPARQTDWIYIEAYPLLKMQEVEE